MATKRESNPGMSFVKQHAFAPLAPCNVSADEGRSLPRPAGSVAEAQHAANPISQLIGNTARKKAFYSQHAANRNRRKLLKTRLRLIPYSQQPPVFSQLPSPSTAKGRSSTVNFSVFLLICSAVSLCLWGPESMHVGALLAAPYSRNSAQRDDKFQRTFAAGDVRQYRIELNVRSELQGEQTEKIGAKTYVRPFSRGAEETIAWRATRSIRALGSDGSAEVEETLDNFEREDKKTVSPGGEETEKLAQALEATLAHWIEPGTCTLRYRETRDGELHGLGPEGVPRLDEATPPVLTLWMLRALRPAAALPARPIVFGDRWQEPRAAKLNPWTDAHADESGQWLEAPATAEAAEPAARLLTAQQILATVASGGEKPPEGTAQARFHGESLVTLSLSDARVLEAARAATREISWTLAPVAGLDKPPEFLARLAAQIKIKECHGACLATENGGAAMRPRN